MKRRNSTGIGETARLTGLRVRTVHKLRRGMATAI